MLRRDKSADPASILHEGYAVLARLSSISRCRRLVGSLLPTRL